MKSRNLAVTAFMICKVMFLFSSLYFPCRYLFTSSIGSVYFFKFWINC